MRPFSHWLQHPVSVLLALGFLFIVIPLASRYGLGWSHPFGYLSDLAIGSLLLVLLHHRAWLLSVPLIVIWCVFTLSTAD
ncbi:MAG TPA: sulfatase, partial [Pseudomonas sp.]|nr:sulfatase [Pseudomonas sp.]